MHKDPVEYLKHILDECSFILAVIKPETSRDQFMNCLF